MTDYHPLDDAALAALMGSVEAGNVGDEIAFACDADPDEHIHIRRIGKSGGGLSSRVAIFSHMGNGFGVTIFLASDEARVFAAKVLDAADDVDGTTPLTYADPRYVAPFDLDTPDEPPATDADDN